MPIMKKKDRYKVLIAIFFAVLFVSIGIFATKNTQLETETQQAVQGLKEQQATQLRDIRNNLMSELAEAYSFDAETLFVYNLSTDKVIFERQAKTPRNLASLAKLLLARTALETPSEDALCIELEDLAAIGDDELVVGGCYTEPDILSAMLMASSNDLALTIDRENPGRNEVLAQYLDTYNLDMVINDPSGYDFRSTERASTGSASEILSVAFDLLLASPSIAHATTRAEFTLGAQVLKHTYPNVEAIPDLRMLKTGYTDLAGGNMLGIVEPVPGEYIGIVVMKSGFDSRFTDFEKLSDNIEMSYRIVQ